MLGFKEFIVEENKISSELNNEVGQEENVQNMLFGINDYTPFTNKNVDESVEVSPDNSKRLVIKGESHQGKATGAVVPRHMWEGTAGYAAGTINNKGKVREKASPPIIGMKKRNVARAKVYGSEQREPLKRSEIDELHKSTLEEHFKKPKEEQIKIENAAIAKLKSAKHLDSGDTTDESEKTDTVNFEHDSKGRGFTAAGSKGVAGHAVYTSGTDKAETHHILNTCIGQTAGCGGGVDANNVADTSKGTCFAPNAESQYPGAAIRRATHEQCKHDPAMSQDWILAHTGSLRKRADAADKKDKRFLFRPNIVDETDTTSKYAIGHLNRQRATEANPKRPDENKPPIIGNGYGKTGEIHDPKNGWHSTFSNIGPKVKNGHPITENINRDGSRISQTITAQKSGGADIKNESGQITPPKNTYMVTDMKRGGALDQDFQSNVTHAKYWSRGREQKTLSPEEVAQGPEGHFNAAGKATTEDKAHYGHTTLNGRRYDYQKQHVLHPRLVDVPITKKGVTSTHQIPTDSRFKDDDFLPKDKDRFKSKNGKNAGGLLVTTPTTSTSDIQHQSSFTHHVDDTTIEHAKAHNGEYEIDAPAEQEKSLTKSEYAAPVPVTITKMKKKK